VKYLAWLLKAAIFFTVFAFALNNQDAVQVNLFFGAHWQAPLVLVLLAALTLGVLLGMLVMVPLWLRAKRVHKTPAPADVTSATVTEEQVPHGV
jgi:lipopolysaccharide assembly protein A